jgi:hypothetical protein
MIKLSKKSLLLFLPAIATAAFAMPSLASAATFDGVGNHTLTSNNLSFTAGAPLNAGSICSSSVLEVKVAVGGATATVTGGTFTGCTGTDGLVGIPAHVTGTGFPWTITRNAVGVFTIDGIHLAVVITGVSPIVTVSGNLGGGTIDNATHTVTYTKAPGLTETFAGFSVAAPVSGDFRDDQGTWAVT